MSASAPSVRVVGPGRAGTAMGRALHDCGWLVADDRGRGDPLADAAVGVDAVIVATPDATIAEVAAAIDPVATTAVVHLAGSLGLDVLAPHRRRAALHPLMALPDPQLGAERLVSGGWFAVAGDPVAQQMADALGGRTFVVADHQRARYHAAAVVASNHVVALLAQVERLAAAADVPVEAFWPLVEGTITNVVELGAAAALTGPAARGDVATIERHRAAIDEPERVLYDVLADAAARLAGRPGVAPG